MKRIIITSLIILGLMLPLTVVAAADPVTMEAGLTEFIEQTGMSEASLPVIIGKIVRIVISFLGLIAAIIIIVGGFQWMTSGGSEEKIAKAKKLMINGIIGLVLVVLAYAIASFVINSLITVAG